MEKKKKPFYKKWWVWLIVIIVIGGLTEAISDDESAESNKDKVVKQSATEDSNNEKGEESEKEKDKTQEVNGEKEDESKLSDEDVKQIKSNLEESLKEEQDFGGVFHLEEFEYKSESNKILARIDMQQDPLPETKEDVKEWAETWTWSIVETNPDVKEDYHVLVTLVTKFDVDEYALWGYSSYDASSGKYKFKEESGMKLYD